LFVEYSGASFNIQLIARAFIMLVGKVFATKYQWLVRGKKLLSKVLEAMVNPFVEIMLF
jgi:hypothetical protein